MSKRVWFFIKSFDRCKQVPKWENPPDVFIITTQMGKKLRSRQLSDYKESKNHFRENKRELGGKLPINTLKKIICKKLTKGSNYSLKQKKFISNLAEGKFYSLVEESRLQCPICLEIMVKPTMMVCGHNYCFRCLESNAAFSQRCCLCRQSQMDVPYIPSKFTEKLIHQIFLPRSDQVIRYLCRTTDSDQWTKRRYVTNIRPGLVVDFHNSLNVWTRAFVLKIQLDSDNKSYAVLKAGPKSIERVETVSKRLAPARFFTKGRYLQQFEPSLPEYDFLEKQLYGIQYRYNVQEQEFFQRRSEQADPFQLQRLFESENEQVQNIPQVPSPVSEIFLDEALVLFNMQMNENDIVI